MERERVRNHQAEVAAPGGPSGGSNGDANAAQRLQANRTNAAGFLQISRRAIQSALSTNSEDFLRQTRQTGGQ
ncbi:MAG: hypothetical protein ACYTHJ_06600 [Planctomycetota bacterium]